MDRPIIYTQEQARSTDFLFGMRAAMTSVAKVCAALFGTSTVVNGLGVTPTSPASLSVYVNAGEIYQLANLDATAYGVLAADTTDNILKQGIMLAQATLSCPAPTTVGYSINYLIEATFAETDTTPVVLPYFNSANPSQPLSGQNNSGATQNTQRQGLVTLQAKAGAAATTGSQTTPAADANYVPLAVVTVAYGQTTIVAGNIVNAQTSPALPAGGAILGGVQGGSLTYAVDSGTANTYQVTFTPAITAVNDGMRLRFRAANANTGASTFSANGLATGPIWSGQHAPLTGGEIVQYSEVELVWNSALNGAAGAWVLLEATGGIDSYTHSMGQGTAVSVSVAGGANVTLTSAQASNRIIILTGAITANINVVVPNTGNWVFENNTSGAFTITVKTSAGSGVVAPQGSTSNIAADGTNALFVGTPRTVIIQAGAAGKGSGSAMIGAYVAPVATTIAANAAGSYAVASAAATASTVYNLVKQAAGGTAQTNVGTITFAASGYTGTFATSGGTAISLAAGDTLFVQTPAGADTTLANVAVSILGTF